MNQKLRAVKRTVGILAVITLLPILLCFLFTVLSTQVIAYLALAIFVCFFIWLTYSICLTQVKQEDSIQASFDAISEITKKY